MRGSCNYKNKNKKKKHKRSTEGWGVGVQINQQGTWLSTSRCKQSTRTKTEWVVRVGGTKGNEGKGKVLLNRKWQHAQLWGCNNAGRMHTQSSATRTHWEITEQSYSANRKRAEVERERSHWNGRTNYMCVGKNNTFKQSNNRSHWWVTCKTNTHAWVNSKYKHRSKHKNDEMKEGAFHSSAKNWFALKHFLN